MKEAVNICRHLLSYVEDTLPALTDTNLAVVMENGKTAGWLLGHLCVTGDFVRRKSGREAMTPKEWGPKFAPGSQPMTAREDYPSADQLRAAFFNVYRDLIETVITWPADLLASPNPFEPARSRFPTMGEFTTWILTGHLAYHLGQLYGWRNAETAE